MFGDDAPLPFTLDPGQQEAGELSPQGAAVWFYREGIMPPRHPCIAHDLELWTDDPPADGLAL